jgi:alkanesulfonate monooxygenase SsuD/methylene tetrahydromethanopterin reductase-like flavin-dependent oxidoreductase (luciferase family)
MGRAVACPSVEIPPELWMLGSSEDSAMLAAKMGLPYSFAFFINAHIRPDILNIYRERFKPSAVSEKPFASLGVFVICADTEEEAIRLSKSRDLWYVRFTNTPKGPTIPSVDEAENFSYTEQQLAF